MKLHLSVAVLLASASLSVMAGGHETVAAPDETRDMPYISTSRSMAITAVVEAINHETREVTLTGPEGNSVSFVASDEVRNLPQVNVGDEVYAEVLEEMSISLTAGEEGQQAGAGELAVTARAEEGDKPGGMAADTQIVTATVEEIDIEANTFKLKDPEGDVQQFTARNPENLKLAKVGDLVVITVTRAIAIAVGAPDSE